MRLAAGLLLITGGLCLLIPFAPAAAGYALVGIGIVGIVAVTVQARILIRDYRARIARLPK